jgi:hypothetical protein
MEYFAGLDVSMEETRVCVVDRDGTGPHRFGYRRRRQASKKMRGAHSAGSGTRWDRLIDLVHENEGRLSERSPFGNPKPLTIPKIAGITIRVSNVDEIMPPIIGTAMRCVVERHLDQPVPPTTLWRARRTSSRNRAKFEMGQERY